MTDEERLQGVWRLKNIDATTPTGAGWTHLVFDGDETRQVIPDYVQYADEPTTRTLFELDAHASPPRIRNHTKWMDPGGKVTSTHDEVGTYDLAEDCLALHWHRDTVFNYVRETDPELVALLSRPPVPVQRGTLDHPVLGRLKWDQNSHSWIAEWNFDSDGPAELFVNASADPDPALLDQVASTLRAISGRIDELKRFAASHLLDLRNTEWREDDEPVLSEDEFVAKLTTDSVETYEDGSLELSFDDGGTFGEHSIDVSIDASRSPTHVGISG